MPTFVPAQWNTGIQVSTDVFRAGSAEGSGPVVSDGSQIVAIGQLHPFRQTSGSRSVELDRGVVRRDRQHRIGGGLRVPPGGEAGPRKACPIHNEMLACCVARGYDRLDHRFKTRANEQDGDTRIGKDRGCFGRGKPPVQRDQHDVGLQRPQQQFEVKIGVLAEIADPCPRAASERDQTVGDLVRVPVKFGVVGHAVAENLCGCSRLDSRLDARDVGQDMEVVELSHCSSRSCRLRGVLRHRSRRSNRIRW